MLSKNKQAKQHMTDRVPSAALVRFWRAGDTGCFTTTLSRHCCMMRSNDARGWSPTAARTVRSKVETKGTTRRIVGESTLGLWPNPRLQRTRPLLRADAAELEQQRLGALPLRRAVSPHRTHKLLMDPAELKPEIRAYYEAAVEE